jgi:lipoprotein-releasing system permease protein
MMFESLVGFRYLVNVRRSFAVQFMFVLGLNLLLHGLGLTFFLPNEAEVGLVGLISLIAGAVMSYVCALAMLFSMYTVIAIMGVTVGVVALTTVLSVMSGLIQDSQDKLIGANSHIIIRKENHGTFDKWREMYPLIYEVPGITGASPNIEDEALITSTTGLSGVLVKGIDPNVISEVSKLPSYITQGKIDFLSKPEKILEEKNKPLPWEDELDELDEQPSSGPDSEAASEPVFEPFVYPPEPILPGILVGKNLAEEQLHVAVGDRVQILTPWGELSPTGPIPKSRSFRIAGIYQSGMYELDAKNIYMSLNDAQDFLSLGDNISGFEVKTYLAERADVLAKELQAKIQDFPGGPYEAVPWQEVNKGLFGAFMLEKRALLLALTITIIVAAFFIVSSLLLLVLQKQREIAILKSMGASNKAIQKIFTLSGVMIGGCGVSCGLFGGFLLCKLIEIRGIPVPESMFNTTNLPVVLDATEFFWVGMLAFLVSALATIYPSMLASRQPPLEGLKV